MRIRLRPVRGQVVGRRPPPPASLDRGLARLVTLQAVVDMGCELQGRAESFLLLCSLPGEPGPAVAREGGEIARQYQRLHAWALDVEGRSSDPESLDQRVPVLLLYHCHVVHAAVRLAFPRSRTAASERRRRELTTLGAPAPRLRAVRLELAAAVAAAEQGTGGSPPPGIAAG